MNRWPVIVIESSGERMTRSSTYWGKINQQSQYINTLGASIA